MPTSWADGPGKVEQWRILTAAPDYLRRHGRICLQFGYSDSGRYVGQLAATYLIERLRLKVVDLLVRQTKGKFRSLTGGAGYGTGEGVKNAEKLLAV